MLLEYIGREIHLIFKHIHDKILKNLFLNSAKEGKMMKNKEVGKILCSYILIVTIPVVILGLLTVGILFNSLASDTEALNVKILEQTGSRIDAELEKVLSLSYEICQNDKIVSFVNTYQQGGSVSKYDELSIVKVLQMYQKSHSICADVGIYLKNMNAVITSDALYTLDEYYNIHLAGGELSYDEWIDSINSSGLKNLFVSAGKNNNGVKNVIYFRKFNDFQKHYSDIVFFSRIDADVVMSKLEFLGNNNEMDFAMLNRAGKTILATDEFEQKRNTSNENVIYKDSKFLDCKYVYLLPDSGLSGNVYVAMILFLFILVITVSVSIFFAIWQSKRIQRRMLAVFDKNSILENDLNCQTEMAKEKAMLNLLYNIGMNDSEQEKIRLEFEEKGCNRFNVMAIAPMRTKNGEIYSKEIDVAFDEVNSLIGKELFEMHIEHRFIRVGKQKYVCVMGYSADVISEHNLQELMEDLLQNYNIVLRIGMGEETDTLGNINISYEEAMTSLRFSLNRNGKVFTLHKEIKDKEAEKPYYTKEKERSLIQNIKMGNVEETENILNEIYQINFVERQLNNVMMKKIILSISMVIYQIIDVIYDQDPDLYEKYSRECYNVGSTEDLEKAFTELKRICMEMCSGRNSKNMNEIVKEKIVAYIAENYENYTLSLNMLSEHLGMNYHYLSRVFAKYMGMSFSEYVSMLRLEKAKKLLKESDATIDEIAKQVGFCEGTSLIRGFKKHFDITPGKYRDQ